jgi:hypothetical protein
MPRSHTEPGTTALGYTKWLLKQFQPALHQAELEKLPHHH